MFEARSEVPGESTVDVRGTNWSIEAFTVNCQAFYCFSMSGVSELLFRHDTMDCFTETCLNHEQYSSLMAPYAENDDLEVFFLSLQSCRFSDVQICLTRARRTPFANFFTMFDFHMPVH